VLSYRIVRGTPPKYAKAWLCHLLAEVGLRVSRRMRERHEHLALAQLPEPHVVLYDRIAARVPVLVGQPLRDPLGGVALLPAFRLVVLQDLVDTVSRASPN
jgi:hypothetical protein